MVIQGIDRQLRVGRRQDMQTQYWIILKHSWLVPSAVNVYEMSLILIIIIVSF